MLLGLRIPGHQAVDVSLVEVETVQLQARKSYFIPLVAADPRTFHMGGCNGSGVSRTRHRIPGWRRPMLDHMSFESLSASLLLRSLTANEHHPHLLLNCSRWEVECVLLGLAQWGARPVRH